MEGNINKRCIQVTQQCTISHVSRNTIFRLYSKERRNQEKLCGESPCCCKYVKKRIQIEAHLVDVT
jgi:hypothetical protein